MSVAVEYTGESERFQKLRESPNTGGGELVQERGSAHFIKVCLSGVSELYNSV